MFKLCISFDDWYGFPFELVGLYTNIDQLRLALEDYLDIQFKISDISITRVQMEG